MTANRTPQDATVIVGALTGKTYTPEEWAARAAAIRECIGVVKGCWFTVEEDESARHWNMGIDNAVRALRGLEGATP